MGGALVLACLTVWSIHTALGAWISRRLPRERSTFLMYATAAILGVSLAFAAGEATFKREFLLVSVVGGYQAWIGYAELHAVRYSLTMTSLVFPMRFVLSAALAALLIGEASLYRSPWLVLGSLLLFTSTIMFRKGENGGKAEEVPTRDRGTFLHWFCAVSAMAFLAGTAGFAMKYFASGLEVPRLVFPSYWYLGAVVGITPVLLVNRKENFVRLTRWDVAAPLRGATAIGQITLEFTVYQFLPLAVASPALAFGTTVAPILLGYFVFAERKEVSTLQAWAIVVGLLGALLLVVARV